MVLTYLAIICKSRKHNMAQWYGRKRGGEKKQEKDVDHKSQYAMLHSLTHRYTHTHTHARTHARTHVRTHVFRVNRKEHIKTCKDMSRVTWKGGDWLIRYWMSDFVIFSDGAMLHRSVFCCRHFSFTASLSILVSWQQFWMLRVLNASSSSSSSSSSSPPPQQQQQ